MKQERFSLLEAEGNLHLNIFVRKTPFIPRLMLALLCLVTIALAIFILVLIAQSGSGLKFGHVLGLLVLAGIATLFAKMLLWNVYGKEVFAILPNAIDYHCDYRYFKGNRIHLEFAELQWLFRYTTSPEIVHESLDAEIADYGEGNLVIRTDKEELISQISIPLSDLREIIEQLTLSFSFQQHS